jgi:hypothetical protein
MDYKFYIPASNKYVQFNNDHDITVWSVYEDGKQLAWLSQQGETDLAVHELLSIGQILEVYKQVKNKTREYDPYAIFSESMKKYALEKASNG